MQADATVVSMSLGSPGYDPAYAELASLLQDAGILWVVPAGNGETRNAAAVGPGLGAGELKERAGRPQSAVPATGSGRFVV